jgi:hypothetical protein
MKQALAKISRNLSERTISCATSLQSASQNHTQFGEENGPRFRHTVEDE